MPNTKSAIRRAKKTKLQATVNKIRKNKYRTTKEYYRSFYTEELIEIVSDFYKRDLELFNYEF